MATRHATNTSALRRTNTGADYYIIFIWRTAYHNTFHTQKYLCFREMMHFRPFTRQSQ